MKKTLFITFTVIGVVLTIIALYCLFKFPLTIGIRKASGVLIVAIFFAVLAKMALPKKR
jgi:hypothetical protein